jgi:hypothetical protein
MHLPSDTFMTDTIANLWAEELAKAVDKSIYEKLLLEYYAGIVAGIKPRDLISYDECD